jgi:hypothetical protein
MEKHRRLLLEVMYKAQYCLPCVYMDEAVRQVLPAFSGRVEYVLVNISASREHKKRFTELSIALHGKEKVYSMEQLAPIPSLFINGELVFDCIPPRDELEEAIETALRQHDVVPVH